MPIQPSGLRGEPLPGAAGIKITWPETTPPRTMRETLAAWSAHPNEALSFAATLAALEYDGIYWECPALTPAALARPFECVALDAPHLACARPNKAAFAEHFAEAEAGAPVVEFSNFSGNTILIAPTPMAATSAYGHLAAFVRAAPKDQIAAFFARAAHCALQGAQHGAVWLSTSGDGVAWLHGRIDSRPKYFQYAAYKQGGQHRKI